MEEYEETEQLGSEIITSLYWMAEAEAERTG